MPAPDTVAETRRQLASWYLSTAMPMHRHPMNAAAFSKISVIVLCNVLAPIDRAKMGR